MFRSFQWLRQSVRGQLALVLVAFMVLFAFNSVYIFRLISQQESDGAVINLAGRQRMLTQQMAFDANASVASGAFQSDHGQGPAASLETVAEFDTNLDSLLHGDSARGIPAAGGAAADQLLVVTAIWEPFHERVIEVHSIRDVTPGVEDDVLVALAYINDNVEALLVESDTAVSLFEGQFSGKIDMLRRVAIGLAVAAGLVAAGGLIAIGHVIKQRETDTSSLRETRRLLEQELSQRKSAEARLLSMMQSAPDAIVVVNADGRIVLVNQQTTNCFGYASEELIGQPLEILIPERFRDKHPGLRMGYTAEAEPRAMGSGLDLVAVRKDGSEFPVEISLSPLETDEGCLVMSAVRDITERKLAEEELARHSEALARSNAELEAFTYSVTHDLKEPLRTLEAFSQFIMEDYAEQLDGQGRDYLEKMSKASVRMKHLIEDLLNLSRIGRETTPPAQVDVGRVIAQIVEGLGAAIEEQGAAVEVEEELPDVLADDARIEQLFANLIGNALKFTKDGQPLVKVGVRSVEDGVCTFYVQDNGIGIDPQYHERVFGIFQRLHRREDYEGTGAGLSIVKRVVEFYGGRVWVESELGAGTTFVFTLPLWTEAAASVEREAA